MTDKAVEAAVKAFDDYYTLLEDTGTVFTHAEYRKAMGQAVNAARPIIEREVRQQIANELSNEAASFYARTEFAGAHWLGWAAVIAEGGCDDD